MENDLLHKVYDFVNNIIHLNDIRHSPSQKNEIPAGRKCPVTCLDISMQPKNSKFLSFTGTKWYYENDKKTFDNILKPRLTNNCLKKNIEIQLREIAHSIRNEDSNPRNNTRRAIRKLVNEQGSLFNNLQLIDKRKLEEAGLKAQGSK